jgi:hypothetical protein
MRVSFGESVSARWAVAKLSHRLKAIVLGWLIPLVVALVIVQLVVYRETAVPGLAPRPASGLQELSSESDLQAHFMADAGHARLLMLVSPT